LLLEPSNTEAAVLEAHLPRATHLVWTTGGLFVPDEEYERFVQRGRALAV